MRLGEVLSGLEEAVVRPAAGVAYVPREVPADMSEPVRALNERIRAQFDPTGVFA